MKPENKLPVLDLISAEMKTVVNTLQPDLPPWPATGTIARRRYFICMEAVLFSAISIPTIASCACWQATANVR